MTQLTQFDVPIKLLYLFLVDVNIIRIMHPNLRQEKKREPLEKDANFGTLSFEFKKMYRFEELRR